VDQELELPQASIKRQRTKSPNEIFYFSMIQDRPRGFEGKEVALQEDEAIEDVNQMGIDW
jgi:hypothetical protein